ncbi:GxxExxY protein [Aquiflexum sp. LQ15W]|jgi:GxxExxY protein|uniref:GxxExxY protein n=1 Tax=Cognataquiflexum TaxID=3020066 RepID=UPI000DEACA53|nr:MULTISPECIES: GxxExxY protein [Cognataquiflexum]MCH6201066.1 GxxExxY protein [Cognataquiflexum nitidum]
MKENEISREVVDACYKIHSQLGPGLYESVYENILFYELVKKGLKVQKEIPIDVIWDGLVFEQGFRADLIVEEKVLVELKSVEEISKKHYKQVLTYLKLTNLKLGLLINFNENLIKDGIRRIVNGLEDQ